MNILQNSQYQKILSHGMKMLGDAWILLIIDQLRKKEKRFSQIEKEILNINPVTLTKRLKKMEQCHLIERDEQAKQTVYYRLTERGQELLPIIDSIEAYIHKHVQAEDCICKKDQ